MNRMFKLPLLIALTLVSTQLLAVDFGQVRVLSNLGQPLLAEIPLHGASPAELKGLTASLASPGEYERAGISGGRTSVPLSFSVVAGPGGEHFIRISSSAPVDDPYLDLLLDVNTAAGKSVHEFAILLDPPSAAEVPIAGAHAPARASTGATTPATPQAATAAAPATQPAAAKPAAAPAPAGQATGTVAKGMYGPVERGQTLSGIAQQTLPAGVDINQMLLAIKQANPDAFYRDNINTLKSGVVLRVPSAADAQAMTVAAAIAEVRRQNGEWRSGEVGAPAAVADAATHSASNAASTEASTGGDRLALLAAKDTAKAGTGGNAAGESATELRKSLLQAQENLASERQQVADLQAHVKQLDDVNRKSERLLSLKDNEIAELQAKLAAARKAGFAAPASAATTAASTAAAALATAQSAAHALAATAPAAAASSPAATPAAAGSAGVAASASSVATGAKASPAPVSEAKPATAPPAVKPSAPVQPWYMQTWAWIAGAGIVVLLILGGLLGRQRKHPASTAGRTAPSLADSFGAAVGEPPADDVDHGELLDQLAEHPDDLGLHLQLVTLYYSRRDVEHFEAAAEAMYAHITDPQQDEWQDVVHMGEDLVPEHPLFSHQAEPPSLPPHAPLEDFNIDDYADEDATLVAPIVESPAAAEASTGYPTVADVPLEFGDVDVDAPDGLHAVSDQLDVSPDQPVGEAVAADDAGIRGDAVESTPVAEVDGVDDQLGEFNDDPIDTKLDLARAYLDMGDEEGARAMLDEVLKEGSQMQKDVATGLLGGLQG